MCNSFWVHAGVLRHAVKLFAIVTEELKPKISILRGGSHSKKLILYLLSEATRTLCDETENTWDDH